MSRPGSSPTAPFGDGYSIQVINDMLSGVSPLGDIPYTNITLTNNEIEGLTSKHSPDALLDPAFLSLYWPGGHPNNGRTFETMTYARPVSEADGATLVEEMRRLVLGASIGSSALGRIPQQVRRISRGFDTSTGHRPEDALAALCMVHGAPLVAVMMSDVISSSEASTGARMAHMYYPLPLSPTRALNTMQSVVRKVIASEEI